MDSITDHKPTYPALDRAEYLAECACMPNYAPCYCAEEAQLFASLAEAFSRRKPPSKDDSE